MKYFLLHLLFLSALNSGAQHRNSFAFTIHVQPEITRHHKNYAIQWNEAGATTTFNAGLRAAVQYRIAGRFFAEAGLGYVPRRMNNTLYFLHN